MRLLQYLLFILFTAFTVSVHAQLELVPILRQPAKSHPAARTQEVSPKRLPFWDDFSFCNTYVQDSLWLYGKSVWANKGIGINPPSIGVVTFDGLDSLGKPYNTTDLLTKGFADQLVSQPLRIDLVDASLRANVFMSFFYQFQGNGEAPDEGDSLFLEFKNKDNRWQGVWSIDNDGTLDKSVFTQVVIPITSDVYYHEGFQFRFRNYARLSGPYDTWNLDYVFVSNGNVSDDPPPFPDRAIVSPITSLLGSYTAMPVKHFLYDPASYLTKPSIVLTNRRSDQINNNGQPVNYVSDAQITTKKGDAVTTESFNLNNNNDSEGVAIYYNTLHDIVLNTIPTPDKFDSDADSIAVKIQFNLTSDDNVIKVTNPSPKGDYVPLVYSPVNFRLNDTTSVTNILSNYYAYDDGSAEYGASLKGAGAQLVYKFDISSPAPDTLVGVYMYFPRFGDESSQILQLRVLKDLLGNPSSELYQESVTLERSQQDQFIYHKFNRFVGVQDVFYFGWQQSTSASIVIGLDKNTDSSGSIYFNTNGVWEQPTLKGSLMLRPVFGKGGVYVGLPEDEKAGAVYPNPNHGSFFLPSTASQIQLLDLNGRSMSFSTESANDALLVSMQNPIMGLYVVRYAIHGKVVAHKIIVRQ